MKAAGGNQCGNRQVENRLAPVDFKTGDDVRMVSDDGISAGVDHEAKLLFHARTWKFIMFVTTVQNDDDEICIFSGLVDRFQCTGIVNRVTSGPCIVCGGPLILGQVENSNLGIPTLFDQRARSLVDGGAAADPLDTVLRQCSVGVLCSWPPEVHEVIIGCCRYITPELGQQLGRVWVCTQQGAGLYNGRAAFGQRTFKVHYDQIMFGEKRLDTREKVSPDTPFSSLIDTTNRTEITGQCNFY